MTRTFTGVTDSLPVIRFAGATDEMLARQLDDAFTGIGFCYVSDIGVDAAAVERLFAASRQFHALPRAAKERSRSTASIAATWR